MQAKTRTYAKYTNYPIDTCPSGTSVTIGSSETTIFLILKCYT